MLIPSDIWWKQVTGPTRLTEQIAQAIKNEHSVRFVIPTDLPWRKELRYCVESLISGENIVIDFVDFKDDYQESSIGMFLLNHYGTDIDRASIRPHKDTFVDYLQKRGILKNKIIWVKGIPDESVDMWLNFIKQYKDFGKQNGQFVIETIKSNTFKSIKNVDLIDYFDYVTKDDAYLFASLLTSISGFPKYLHQYITTAASCICEYDSEVLADYIEYTEFESKCPIISLKELFNNDYSDNERGIRNTKTYTHPFYFVRNNQDDELQKRLWVAQLRIVFPLIEQERISFIKRYCKDIEKYLPIGYLGEQITNPFDLEIGPLSYIINSNYVVGIKEDERDRIRFMKSIRNKLAHLSVCSVEEMNRILHV